MRKHLLLLCFALLCCTMLGSRLFRKPPPVYVDADGRRYQRCKDAAWNPKKYCTRLSEGWGKGFCLSWKGSW